MQEVAKHERGPRLVKQLTDGRFYETVAPMVPDSASGNVHAPAANTAAVITKAAAPGTRHVIDGLGWSYDNDPTTGTPAAGRLTVTVNGATVFDVSITSKGPGFIPAKIRSGVNEAVVVTLAAAGANITGKVNLLAYWTE